MSPNSRTGLTSRTVPALCLGTLLVGCGGGGGSSVAPSPPPAPDAGAPFTVGIHTLSRSVEPFSVLGASGERYSNPFLGGLDVPRPRFVDLDRDGDLDLLLQERSGELIHLENVGSPRAPDFRWRTDRFQDLDIGEWARFADLDDDGDLDLLAERPFSYIRVFRNDGRPGAPAFTPLPDTLRTPAGEPIFSDRQNLPWVIDLDCNGLLDLFLGRVDGTVARYEEVEGARSDTGIPVFALVAERFEDIEIVAQIGTAHGANSMAFADEDGDGDPDLYWGDFFEPSVLFIENRGSCARPDFRAEPRPLPGADSLSTSGYNAPAPVDLDADGDLDLVIGVLGGAFNPNASAADNLWYYEHSAPGDYTLRTRRFISGIDGGSESIPELTDWDGDSDLDLLLGTRLDPTHLDAGRILLFENTGTPTAPAFVLADTLALLDQYHHAPAAGDLDGDGRADLLVGNWRRGIAYFRNRGSGGPRERFEMVSEALVEFPRGGYGTPALGDLDGDGDLDLLVGESSGEINYFRNRGDRASPDFELVTEALGGIDVGRRSHPSLIDIDGDGDLDLVVGRESEGLLLFRNVGTPEEPRFSAEPEPDSIPSHPMGAPVWGDLDSDGRVELLTGTLAGGVLYFRGSGR